MKNCLLSTLLLIAISSAAFADSKEDQINNELYAAMHALTKAKKLESCDASHMYSCSATLEALECSAKGQLNPKKDGTYEDLEKYSCSFSVSDPLVHQKAIRTTVNGEVAKSLYNTLYKAKVLPDCSGGDVMVGISCDIGAHTVSCQTDKTSKHSCTILPNSLITATKPGVKPASVLTERQIYYKTHTNLVINRRTGQPSNNGYHGDFLDPQDVKAAGDTTKNIPSK